MLPGGFGDRVGRGQRHVRRPARRARRRHNRVLLG
jgi:hypothetical protein